jgi:hypothetical protein
MTILKHEVDDVSGVPENLRGLYQEADGKYTVPENLRGVADAITGLFQANGNIRKENKDLLRRSQIDLSGLEGFGEDFPTVKQGVLARLAELEEAAAKGAEGKLNVDKVRQEMKAALDKAVADERKVSDALRGTVHKYLVNSTATQALADEGGLVELAMPFVERQVKVIEQDGEFRAVVVDADGDPRISGGTGQPMTIRELVLEMRRQEKYAPLFRSEAKGGSGAKPGQAAQAAKGGAGQQKEMTAMDRIKKGLADRRAA